MQRNATVYIRADSNPPNPEELKKHLSSGNLEEKATALKQLVRCIINDEAYPRMIMHIITTIIPVIQDSNALRKTMLLYWQVIEKNKSATDDTLKDEMFLACNSLRNDLLHSNEYLRARTLRLISRILHRGIVDPLANAILENLTHKSSYVRRNAVVCLYQVFLHFGVDVIGDIDEEVEKLLLTETDLSTKRNAFLLLHQSNPQKAMEYIQNQMANQNLEEMGDILQLAILEVFRRKCKQDPAQKPKLLRMIMDFSKKASESVMLQCAIALTSISNSSATLRNALNAYVSILSSTSELNVKKVILDKLQLISGNSKYLQDIVGDLIAVLSTPSYEIKEKVLQIIRFALTLKNAQKVLQQIEAQFQKCEDSDYELQLIKTIQHISLTFPETHEKVLKTITEKVFPCNRLQPLSCKIVKDILIQIIENQVEPEQILLILIDSFQQVANAEIYKGLLYIFGTYITDPKLICKALDRIKLSIGSLPINKSVQSENKEVLPTPQGSSKKVVKTIILPDGTYGTQVIDEFELLKQPKDKTLIFREFIVDDSILGGIMVRNVSKMFYKLRNDPGLYNKYGCSILMIFCSLLRFYQQNIYQIDQASIDQISYMIKLITNPKHFEENSALLKVGLKVERAAQVEEESTDVVQKNPDDTIVFRQLKPKANVYQIDFDDEEINQAAATGINESTELISKLKTLTQLTGYFDPIYAETFVTVKNYDVFFEILLINNTNINLLNVQIEFSSNSDVLVLEKASNLNLKPGQAATVRSHIKFTKSQFGSVFGNINYDNQAGIEQAYLVTQEIKIDFLQFIYPAMISLPEFRQLWKLKEFEQSVTKQTSNTNIKDILRQNQGFLHAKVIDHLTQGTGSSTTDITPEDHFVNAHLYGKSKLGEDFLITLVIVRGEKTQLSYSIKAKEKEMVQLLARKITTEFKIQEEEE